MGPLILPSSGSIYMDSNAFIYAVERIAPFHRVLDTVWNEAQAKQVPVVTSDIKLSWVFGVS